MTVPRGRVSIVTCNYVQNYVGWHTLQIAFMTADVEQPIGHTVHSIACMYVCMYVCKAGVCEQNSQVLYVCMYVCVCM